MNDTKEGKDMKRLQRFFSLLLLTLTISGIPGVTLGVDTLMTEGFEGDFPSYGWTILNLGDQSDGETWTQGEENPHSGNYYAFSQDGESGFAMEEWLVTNPVSIPDSVDVTLKFWHQHRWPTYGDGPEYVLISSTNSDPASFTDTVFTRYDSENNSEWEEVTLGELPNYSSETIYIAFVHTSANGYADAWCLDDILLTAEPTVANDAGFVEFIEPGDQVMINTPISPVGVIRNFGISPIVEDFDVQVEIVNSDSSVVYSEVVTYTDSLAAGTRDTVYIQNPWNPTVMGSYEITGRTLLPDDERPGNDSFSQQFDIIQHFGEGGPDQFGYRWIDSEVSGGPTYDWIEIAETGTSLVTRGVPEFSGDDNFCEAAPMGFSLPYYGHSVDSFLADINGEMLLNLDNTWYSPYPSGSWDSDGNMFNYYQPIPGATSMKGLVAAYWDDLEAIEGVGDIYYQLFGDAPDRYTVVEWQNLKFHTGGESNLTFQVIFHEDGTIKLQYQNVGDSDTAPFPHYEGRSATVGLQSMDATMGLAYLFEIVEDNSYVGVDPPGNTLHDSLAIQFYVGEDSQPPTFVYETKGNTFSTTPEFTVTIQDASPLSFDSLYYNIGNGWESVTHTAYEAPTTYHYQLPEIPRGSEVQYYYEAGDTVSAENVETLPENAPAESFSFRILPTDGVETLLAYSGSADYTHEELNKYKTLLDSIGVEYDVFDWEEYKDPGFELYENIFLYVNEGRTFEKLDSLSANLMDYLDTGTDSAPVNLFLASDNFATKTHALGNSHPLSMFWSAYVRGVYISTGAGGGTNGLGGPDEYNPVEGSMMVQEGSVVGTPETEIPVYAKSPDVIWANEVPPWFEDDVVNPEIISQMAFRFFGGPFNGYAYSYNNPYGDGCGIFLDNLIYKVFFMSFNLSDVSEITEREMILENVYTWWQGSVDNAKENNQLPETFALSNNYPNPFNPTTTISYQIPELTNVQLEVYDLLGRKIKTLVNTEKQPGKYTITWNGKNEQGIRVGSGIYFYSIDCDGKFQKTQKMVLLK